MSQAVISPFKTCPLEVLPGTTYRNFSRFERRQSSQQNEWQAAVLAQSAVEMAVPCRIGDCADFYTGIHHATSVGKLFRPDEPLLPNYKWVPIGYHGRASSIGVSGQTFHRPLGQTKGPSEA